MGPTLIIIIGSTGSETNHRDKYLLDKWLKWQWFVIEKLAESIGTVIELGVFQTGRLHVKRHTGH